MSSTPVSTESASTRLPLSIPAQNYHIPWDSVILKVLSCIPVIGFFMQGGARQALNERTVYSVLSSTDCSNSLVRYGCENQVLQVSNHYKACGIARNLLFIALIIAEVALDILLGGLILAIPLLLITSFLLLGNIVELINNKEKISRNNQMIAAVIRNRSEKQV
jgi:hypothetical protein